MHAACSMLLLEADCPTCDVGPVAFCRYATGAQLGALCTRCDTLYPNPENMTASTGIYPPHGALPEESPPQWATQNEIEIRGWLHHIAGEWVIVSETNGFASARLS